MNERLKQLRKSIGITQEEFSKRIGIKRNTLANYEIGRNEPIDAVIFSICREFNINEEWLRNGNGEMYRTRSEAEEIADYVSELLEDDGSNPVYAMIKEVMKTYIQLDPKSQEVINEACHKLIENLTAKKEG